MIKTLRRRFVLSAMAAITLLIIVVLGGINVVNAVRIRNENDALLEGLAGMGGIRRNESMPGFNERGNGDVSTEDPGRDPGDPGQ